MYWGIDLGVFFMGLSMVVFWGLVIAAIVLPSRLLGGKRRHAMLRGQIDDEEYRRRLALLRGTGQAVTR